MNNINTFHLLNGDCLSDQLRKTNLSQNHLVFREALVVGNVKSETLTDFWNSRAAFISHSYGVSKEDYFTKTVQEFEKMNAIPNNSEICLWFENDLFCQVNLWFLLSFLSNRPSLKVYRVFPVFKDAESRWEGFGNADAAELAEAYRGKVLFSPEDIALGTKLWRAYQNHDVETLLQLSKTASPCYQSLEEVCQAHVDRFPQANQLGRPERVLMEILATQGNDFKTVFASFSKREGVYGFGDLQVKTILEKLSKMG